MVQRCSICLTSVNLTKHDPDEKKTRLEYLWNYLHHKNVRESAMMEVGNEDHLSYFSYALTVGKKTDSAAENNESTPMCESCNDELEEMDELCQELEAVKRKIDEKVGKIGKRVQSSSALASQAKSLKVSVSGSVVGKENIGQALTYLGSLFSGAPNASSEETEIERSEGNSDSDSEPLEPPRKRKAPKKKPVLEESDSEPENENGSERSLAVNADSDDDSSDTAEKDEDFSPKKKFQGGSKKGKRKLQKKKDSKKKSGGKNGFVCETCDKKFSLKDTLDSHRRTHTGEKPYKCDRCSEGFAFRNSLYRHKKKAHKGKK